MLVEIPLEVQQLSSLQDFCSMHRWLTFTFDPVTLIMLLKCVLTFRRSNGE